MKQYPTFLRLAVSALCLLFCLAFSTAALADASPKAAPRAKPAPIARTAPKAKPAPLPAPAPQAKAEPAAGKKEAPAKSVAGTAAPATVATAGKKDAPTAPAAQKAPSSDPVQQKLDEFACNTLASMNKHIRPGLSAKEVVKNPDGTFTARYKCMDVNSLRTYYKKPEAAKVVTYIGIMDYHKLTLECRGATKDEALQGPFKEVLRMPTTELIKYVKGVWRY